MTRQKFRTLALGKPAEAPNHGARAHAKWSSSSSERWLNCDACIQLTEKSIELFGEMPSSAAADEGTLAHECLEDIFKNPGKGAFAKYTKEMIDHARECVSWVKSITPPDAFTLIETKAPLDFIGADMGGTLDVAIVEPFKSLHVIDYKYGKGHIVSPIENTQLISYALSIAERYDWNFEAYRFSIYQPRTAGRFPYRSWLTTPKVLESYVRKLRDAHARTLSPNPKPTQGEWCFFCPGKRVCPAFAEKAVQKTKDAFASDSYLYEVGEVKPAAVSVKRGGPNLGKLRAAF